MSRFLRFLVFVPLLLGGLLLFFVSAVHVAQVTGILSSEHNWKSLIKQVVLPGEDRARFPKVRKAIRPRAVVILDAGHGGRDGGTVAGDSLEKELNMKVVHLVAEQLRKERIRVVFTRQGDATKSLRNRVDIANGYPSAIFVSVHHNASTSSKPEGIETYYTNAKPASAVSGQRRIFDVEQGERFIDHRGELLAREIQAASCELTQAVDRGVKDGGMALTRLVSCPAVLVECGFLSNVRERARLKDKGYRQKLSDGISRGILAFVGKVEGNPYHGIEGPGGVAPGEVSGAGGQLPGNSL